jgi:hypothetical protein
MWAKGEGFTCRAEKRARASRGGADERLSSLEFRGAAESDTRALLVTVAFEKTTDGTRRGPLLALSRCREVNFSKELSRSTFDGQSIAHERVIPLRAALGLGGEEGAKI